MGDFIILNDSDSVMLSNPQNTQVYSVSVATIRAFAASNNSFIVGRNSDGIGYWARYFNITTDLTDVYLADYTYMSNSRSGFNFGLVSITENAQGMYGYNGSSMVSMGYNAPSYTETIDDISYRYVSDHYNSSFPCMIYIGRPISGNIYINGQLPITYNWSSVPAISGKNGILSLTQILNVNDGEPVENVTNRGNLDFSKKTKVNTLINSAYEPTYSEDETKATVSYDIPESDYQYTKLVYKKKKIPKSVSDGDAIDLNADATEIVVNNLDEDSKYYFKIFTDKTQSNSYKYSTGSNPLPEGKWQETISTCKATDDSFSMSFTEDMEQWKINQNSATDEWVWLSSLGGYNLTTCSVDVETALNNLNLITDATLNAGNHPARYYSTSKEHFEKTWNWDNTSFVHIQQNGTGYIGWDFRFTAQFFGNFNMQYTTTEVCYGGDFMIAVNHYTMQAVFVWLRWSHHDGNPMALAKTKSSTSNTLYYCITKFIN